MQVAMTETSQDPASRPNRRRPFATWVKKLAHFKAGVSSDGRSNAVTSKRHLAQMKLASKKRAAKNNPYPLSGRVASGSAPNDSYGFETSTSASNYYDGSTHRHHNGHTQQHHHHRNGSRPSFLTSQSGLASSSTSLGRSRRSSIVENSDSEDDIDNIDDGESPRTAGARSVAPTVSTDRDVPRSVLAPSNGAASTLTGTTSRTLNDRNSRRGGDSTFSSPAPSVRSLTTTLTTIQSLAPAQNGAAHGGNTNGAPSIGGTSGNGVVLNNTNSHSIHGHHHHSSLQSTTQTIHFHQPFPSTPASAIPSHLTPSGGLPGAPHPTTYTSATANNLLTDNASILTLASSSKRRRRRSLDTDASVRALAPSSIFGGSRESLPLSILSANIEGSAGGNNNNNNNNNSNATNGSVPATPLPLHAASSRMSVASAGLASAAAAERTSIYSTTGALPSDRNSFYAGRQNVGGGGGGGTGDGASMRSVRSGRSGRSGFLGHGRSESVTGSIGGSLTSPLASPLASPREASREGSDATPRPLPAVAATKATSSPATPGSAGGASTEGLKVEEEVEEESDSEVKEAEQKVAVVDKDN